MARRSNIQHLNRYLSGLIPEKIIKPIPKEAIMINAACNLIFLMDIAESCESLRITGMQIRNKWLLISACILLSQMPGFHPQKPQNLDSVDKTGEELLAEAH